MVVGWMEVEAVLCNTCYCSLKFWTFFALFKFSTCSQKFPSIYFFTYLKEFFSFPYIQNSLKILLLFFLSEQQYSPSCYSRAMFRLDMGFPWDPFYRVEVVGGCVMGWTNLESVKGLDYVCTKAFHWVTVSLLIWSLFLCWYKQNRIIG